MNYNELVKLANKTYDEIVYFRKKDFIIPSGKSGKFLQLSFWLTQCNEQAKLNGIALKAFIIIPSLLLQKPSAKSKAKDRSNSLGRRLEVWENGKFKFYSRRLANFFSLNG